MYGKKKTVVDAGTPPTDPLYDASHPDEKKKKKKYSSRRVALQETQEVSFPQFINLKKKGKERTKKRAPFDECIPHDVHTLKKESGEEIVCTYFLVFFIVSNNSVTQKKKKEGEKK